MKIDRLRLKLLRMLDGVIMTETEIRAEVERGSLHEYSLDLVQSELTMLQMQNKIRWIAFRGWTAK